MRAHNMDFLILCKNHRKQNGLKNLEERHRVPVISINYKQLRKEEKQKNAKGERVRYIQLNSEFQRIAKRDKDFLHEQCKEIEESSRMGKTRDLFEKIGDIKGIFHARICPIMNRNGKDLTEAEQIKKRWPEYTKELYKKDLHDPDNQDGMITCLESDILECEVK